MSRIMHATLLAAGLACLLTSCRKEHAVKTNENGKKHQYKASNSSKTIPINGLEVNNMPWSQLTTGYDINDEDFRKAKLFYALGLREIVKDSTIAHWIYDQAKIAENNVIYLDDVFAQFPGTQALVEGVVDPYGVMTGWSLQQVTAKMQYSGFDIKPSIFLMNADNADGSYKPLVSPGDDLDVDDSLRGDVVLAWHLDNSNVATAVNLWESLAVTLDAPVFCIDGVATNAAFMDYTSDTSMPTARTTEYFPLSDDPNMRVTITKYRFNYRYDASARSEVNVIGVCVGATDPSVPSSAGFKRPFFRQDCLNPSTYSNFQLVDMHKRDIGKTMNSDRYFAKAYTPWPLSLLVGEYDHYMLGSGSTARLMNRKFLAYNCYERDGFASEKKLMSGHLRGNTHPALNFNMSGRMSKYDEWYLFNPDDNFMYYSINLPFPYIGWTLDDDHPKGRCELKMNSHCTY